MTCNMKLLVSTIGQHSLIIFSHKDINWLIIIDNLIFAILTHDGAKFKIPQNWINISDLNLLSFFFNTVTIWVLIYFLINRCSGITVKWVLHTCTSKLKRTKGTVQLYIYKHLLCFYMYFCCNCNANTRLQYSFAEVLSYIYYLIKQLSKYLRQK